MMVRYGGEDFLGLYACPYPSMNYTGHWFAAAYVLRENNWIESEEVGYTPDENGSAFAVIYV